MSKTHWKKAFNKDYLGAHDLEEGQELKVVVKKVEVRDIVDPQGKKEQRNVAIFEGKVKPMILNATACKTLQKFSGSTFIENWVNLSIQIYAAEVKAFGEVVDALRIREKQPSMQKPVLNDKHPKWPDAVKAVKEGTKIESIQKRYEVSPDVVEALKNAAQVTV